MRKFFFALSIALMLVGCRSETVIHDISEKEANDILLVLMESKIEATKVARDTGREVLYSINVPAGSRLNTLRVLNRNNFPRRRLDDYASVFSEGGLIPTSEEEKAKKLQAIEGEVEKQLMLVPDVVDAQVNLVIPTENPLRTGEEPAPLTTASVTLKYVPGAGATKPMPEERVQKLVSAAVEKLSPDRVEVFMVPTGPTGKAGAAGSAACPPAGSGRGPLGSLTAQNQKYLLILVGVVIGLLSFFLFLYTIRLRNVRGRLIRLQSEIAKARRKSPEVPATTG